MNYREVWELHRLECPQCRTAKLPCGRCYEGQRYALLALSQKRREWKRKLG